MITPNKVKNIDKKELQRQIYEFLTNEGNNSKLANIMSNTKGYCDKGRFEVKLMSLDNLIRIAGPEKDMQYFEEKEIWDKKISQMASSLENGWKPPCLIVWDTNKGLTIADGSHRIEALKKLGIKQYECIIWYKES